MRDETRVSTLVHHLDCMSVADPSSGVGRLRMRLRHVSDDTHSTLPHPSFLETQTRVRLIPEPQRIDTWGLYLDAHAAPGLGEEHTGGPVPPTLGPIALRHTPLVSAKEDVPPTTPRRVGSVLYQCGEFRSRSFLGVDVRS